MQTRSCDHVDFHIEEEANIRNANHRGSIKQAPARNTTANPETKGMRAILIIRSTYETRFMTFIYECNEINHSFLPYRIESR